MPRQPLPKESRELLVRLGENVRRERLRNGLTQEALAELVDLHPRVVQKIEGGKTNILVTTAARLQAVLQCSFDSMIPAAIPGKARKGAPK